MADRQILWFPVYSIDQKMYLRGVKNYQVLVLLPDGSPAPFVYDEKGLQRSNPFSATVPGTYISMDNGWYDIVFSTFSGEEFRRQKCQFLFFDGSIKDLTVLEHLEVEGDIHSVGPISTDDPSGTRDNLGLGPLSVVPDPSAQQIIDLRPDLASPSRSLGSSIVSFTQAGAGAVTRSVMSKLEDVVNIRDFGAICDGVADDTAAIQKAIDACIATGRPWVLIFPEGNIKITDELNFTQATTGYRIQGAASKLTWIQPTSFGANKAVFNMDSFSVSGSRQEPIYVVGFRIGTSFVRRTDPMGIYAPKMSNMRVWDVVISALGNTGIFVTGAFNCDFDTVDIHSSGWQPLWRNIDEDIVRGNITAESDTLTATADVFEPGDVGQVIYIPNAGPSGALNMLATTITAFIDAQTVTVSPPAYSTATNVQLSFDVVRGSITAFTNTLTLNAPGFTSDDVGRYIYIDGASNVGGLMVVRIASVVSPVECTLETNAPGSVTNNRVWFAAGLFIGEPQNTRANNAINDVRLAGVNIERYVGIGLGLINAKNIHCDHLKLHGRGNEFGDHARASCQLVMDNSTPVFINSAELDYGCTGVDTGNFVVCGDDGGLWLDQIGAGALVTGGYFVDFRAMATRAAVVLGSSYIGRNVQYDAGFIKYGNMAARSKVWTTGGVTSVIGAQTRYVGLPHSASSYRSGMAMVADDGVTSFRPDRTSGMLYVWSESSQANGVIYYRSTGTPSTQARGVGTSVDVTTGPLTGTTGADGQMTISAAADGLVYIENRTGSARNIGWSTMS